MEKEKKTSAEQYARINLLIANEQGGLTLGKVARAIGLSKTRTLYYLRLMVSHGEIYRCRVVNGHSTQFDPVLYFSAERMEKMLNGAPETGQEYQIRQLTIFEVLQKGAK